MKKSASWKEQLKQFIRKNAKILSGTFATAFVGLLLAGCAGTIPTVPTTSTGSTTSVTAPTTSASQGVSSAQKKAFLTWAESCQSVNLAKYGAMTAIEANKIPTADFPQIRDALATLAPLCSTYPSNPTLVESQITDGLSQLALAMGQNMINHQASSAGMIPIPSTGTSTTLGAAK